MTHLVDKTDLRTCQKTKLFYAGWVILDIIYHHRVKLLSSQVFRFDPMPRTWPTGDGKVESCMGWANKAYLMKAAWEWKEKHTVSQRNTNCEYYCVTKVKLGLLSPETVTFHKPVTRNNTGSTAQNPVITIHFPIALRVHVSSPPSECLAWMNLLTCSFVML